jgi:hypothetical protein
MTASSSATTVSNASSAAAAKTSFEFPYDPEDLIQGATRAIKRAKADGIMRQIVKIPIPKDERMYKILGVVETKGTSAETDLDPWPGGIRQMYGCALPLSRRMLRLINGATESAVTDSFLDDVGEMGLVYAQGEKAIDDTAMVVFPNNFELEQLEKVDKGIGDKRLLTLLNPDGLNSREVKMFNGLFRGAIIDRYFDRGYKDVYEVRTWNFRNEEISIVGEYGVGWKVLVQLDPSLPDMTELHDGLLPEKPSEVEMEKMMIDKIKDTPWSRAGKRKAKNNDFSL